MTTFWFHYNKPASNCAIRNDVFFARTFYLP